MTLSYQMQLHLAHKQRQQRFLKAAVKFEKKKKRKPYSRGAECKMVLSVVADFYDTSYKMMWKSKNKLMAGYRNMVYYFCYKILNYSYAKIAKGLSLCKYTIADGLQAFRKQLVIEPKLVDDLRAIQMKFNYKYM